MNMGYKEYDIHMDTYGKGKGKSKNLILNILKDMSHVIVKQ